MTTTKASSGGVGGGNQLVLESIKYTRGSLFVLDQIQLPSKTEHLPVENCSKCFELIKNMNVRGAPAIAITAALSIAVELEQTSFADGDAALFQFVKTKAEYLLKSRPTAVNLGNMVKSLIKYCEEIEHEELNNSGDENGEKGNKREMIVRWCEDMLETDIRHNKAIGEIGAKALLKACCNKKKLKVLTCCNTGSLATAGYGTALGVVRSLHEQGRLEMCYAVETRPYNQGSRLTAYELVYENIPGTLICDNMAAFLMQKDEVDAIIVGADRVAKNGDTANKIGTYSLAVLAKHHDVPFFVAAPSTTLDVSTKCGMLIEIEERPGEEVCVFKGERVAAEGINVWNPAFDITPAWLIEGIVTERTCLYKNKRGEKDQTGAAFDIGRHVEEIEAMDGTMKKKKKVDEMDASKEKDDSAVDVDGFYALNLSTVLDYVAYYPKVCAPIGGKASREDWVSKEVGDGNINFVYIIMNKKTNAAIVLKQGLPYVRCVGESWPLTQERVRYEAEALIAAHGFCPEHVPEVYLYDSKMSTIAMRYIEPPNKIARVGLCEGKTYVRMAEHVGKYLAETLFKSSSVCLGAKKFRENRIAFGGNEAMCALTEQVIFTEPYGVFENNKWTHELNDIVREIQSDGELKVAITELKAKFINECEALLHGDLHTGSIMCGERSTYVIDHEFAFYGPMAFDIGAFIANLYLAYYASDGLGHSENHKKYLQCMIKDVLIRFVSDFSRMWRTNGRQKDFGGLSHPSVFSAHPNRPSQSFNSPDEKHFQQSQLEFISRVIYDAHRFAGAKIIRRIIGIAHVADMEGIQNLELKAKCERAALEMGMRLLKGKYSCKTSVRLSMNWEYGRNQPVPTATEIENEANDSEETKSLYFHMNTDGA